MSLEGSSNNVQEVQQDVDLAPEANESAQTLSFDELDKLTDDRNEKELFSEAKKEIKGEENKSESKEKSSGEKTKFRI